MKKDWLLHYFEGDGYAFEWFDSRHEMETFIEDNGIPTEWVVGKYDTRNIEVV